MGNIIGVLSRKVLDVTSSLVDYIQFLILIVVSVGIWRVSNKYKGSIIWSNLAKSAVAILGIIILASFLS